MKRIVIIDALNLFIRNYVVNPTMNAEGHPIGGCIGFIKSLQKICRELRPDEVVICWDGIGGSQKKKAKNKEYKAGRKPIRFNRRMIDLDPTLQDENRIFQQIRLFEYLNEMPVLQLSVDGIEADDVIAYVCYHKQYKGSQKIIVSSDKDFFQLCDDETIVYRPIQNEIVTKGVLTTKYGIHPNNFALARAIVGDKSDNLPGIKGVGLKTVANNFEFLSEAKQYDLDELIDVCRDQKKPKVSHTNIMAGREIIADNYDMMQLYAHEISYINKKSIDYNIENFEPDFNKLNMTKMLFKDGQGSLRLDELYNAFKNLRS